MRLDDLKSYLSVFYAIVDGYALFFSLFLLLCKREEMNSFRVPLELTPLVFILLSILYILINGFLRQLSCLNRSLLDLGFKVRL